MNKNQIKFIYILSALIYFTQGIGGLVSQPLYYYLKETLGIAVGTIMMLTSLTSIPWMIKPIYGLLSDNYPIWGYKRKSYIVLSGLLSAITCLFLGISPMLALYLLFILMIVDSLGGAIKDVAIDGLMVEEGKKYNSAGKIQSVQWGFLTVAQILTGVGGGYIAEHFDYRFAYMLMSIFPLLIILFAFRYKEKVTQRKKLKLLLVLKNYVVVFKNHQFLLSTLFLFLLWFSPSIGTPIFAKLRDELHMSKMWIGWLGTIGSIASVLGAILYFKLGEKINLKKWLYIGTIVSGVSTLAYLYLTPTSVLTYNILFGVSGMFINLVVMNFMARTCPKGTEATTFALLCSVVNFGGFLSGIIGGKLYNMMGYNGLVIISGLTTLITLVFIPFLRINKE